MFVFSKETTFVLSGLNNYVNKYGYTDVRRKYKQP